MTTRRRLRTERQLARLLAALPADRTTLAEKLVVDVSRIDTYLRELRATQRVHVGWWQQSPRQPGHHMKVWAAGNRRDAIRPPRWPKADLARARYQRRKAEDPAAHEAVLAVRRLASLRNHIPKLSALERAFF